MTRSADRSLRVVSEISAFEWGRGDHISPRAVARRGSSDAFGFDGGDPAPAARGDDADEDDRTGVVVPADALAGRMAIDETDRPRARGPSHSGAPPFDGNAVGDEVEAWKLMSPGPDDADEPHDAGPGAVAAVGPDGSKAPPEWGTRAEDQDVALSPPATPQAGASDAIGPGTSAVEPGKGAAVRPSVGGGAMPGVADPPASKTPAQFPEADSSLGTGSAGPPATGGAADAVSATPAASQAGARPSAPRSPSEPERPGMAPTTTNRRTVQASMPSPGGKRPSGAYYLPGTEPSTSALLAPTQHGGGGKRPDGSNLLDQSGAMAGAFVDAGAPPRGGGGGGSGVARGLGLVRASVEASGAVARASARENDAHAELSEANERYSEAVDAKGDARAEQETNPSAAGKTRLKRTQDETRSAEAEAKEAGSEVDAAKEEVAAAKSALVAYEKAIEQARSAMSPEERKQFDNQRAQQEKQAKKHLKTHARRAVREAAASSDKKRRAVVHGGAEAERHRVREEHQAVRQAQVDARARLISLAASEREWNREWNAEVQRQQEYVGGHNWTERDFDAWRHEQATASVRDAGGWADAAMKAATGDDGTGAGADYGGGSPSNDLQFADEASNWAVANSSPQMAKEASQAARRAAGAVAARARGAAEACRQTARACARALTQAGKGANRVAASQARTAIRAAEKAARQADRAAAKAERAAQRGGVRACKAATASAQKAANRAALKAVIAQAKTAAAVATASAKKEKPQDPLKPTKPVDTEVQPAQPGPAVTPSGPPWPGEAPPDCKGDVRCPADPSKSGCKPDETCIECHWERAPASTGGGKVKEPGDTATSDAHVDGHATSAGAPTPPKPEVTPEDRRGGSPAAVGEDDCRKRMAKIVPAMSPAQLAAIAAYVGAHQSTSGDSSSMPPATAAVHAGLFIALQTSSGNPHQAVISELGARFKERFAGASAAEKNAIMGALAVAAVKALAPLMKAYCDAFAKNREKCPGAGEDKLCAEWAAMGPDGSGVASGAAGGGGGGGGGKAAEEPGSDAEKMRKSLEAALADFFGSQWIAEVVTDIVMAVIWGDFDEHSSLTKFFAQLVISVIPGLGQFDAARSVVAAIRQLAEDPSDLAAWTTLVGAIALFIPGAGPVLKRMIEKVGKSAAGTRRVAMAAATAVKNATAHGATVALRVGNKLADAAADAAVREVKEFIRQADELVRHWVREHAGHGPELAPAHAGTGRRAPRTRQPDDGQSMRMADETEDLAEKGRREAAAGKPPLEPGTRSRGGAPTAEELALRDRAPLLNADDPIIDHKGKFTDYALNENHPVGGNKAIVFRETLGYTAENSASLEAQIRASLPKADARLGTTDKFGTRFSVDTQVTGPNGATKTVRSAWIYDPGASRPRLVSVYVK